MRARQAQKDAVTVLSGRERGAIEEFLVYIEERVRDVEPVCANLVRMARMSLAAPREADAPGRALH